MDFDRLRAFVWTLEEGGISAAARRLHRTQPAVTRMLQTLEDQLGAPLIDRKARPMRPTAAGLRVLELARTILNTAERLRDGRVHPAAAAQTLRLGVSRSLLWHLRDARFVSPPPPLSGTDFFVRSGWSPRIYRRFTRGELDSAVLLMPAPWTPDVPYTGRVVRGEQLALIGPRRPNQPARRAVTCQELDGQPWILNPDGCGFRAALARALASCGRRLHVRFEVDAAPQEHLAMVAAGMGLSIVPASALTQNPRLAAQVQQLSTTAFDGALNVWVIWSEQARPVPGTVEALETIFATADVAPPLRLAPDPPARLASHRRRRDR
jgi:DNA-binding transcriptional LysR family regulator